MQDFEINILNERFNSEPTLLVCSSQSYCNNKEELLFWPTLYFCTDAWTVYIQSTEPVIGKRDDPCPPSSRFGEPKLKVSTSICQRYKDYYLK